MTRVMFVQGTAERAGAERIFLSLLKHIDRSRFEPVVAFMAEGPFVDEVRELGFEIHLTGRCPRIRQVRGWKKTIEELADLAERVKPDLICGNGERVSVFTGRAASRLNIPSVAWLQDSPGAAGLASWATQLALKSAKNRVVVVCARWMTEAFDRSIGLETQAIVSGLDLDQIPPSDGQLASLKAERGWDHEALVVAHFARLQRWKGTHVFLRAAAEVAERRDDVVFLVVGDSLYGREMEYRDELHALSRELGLDERVHFTGYRSDALELMGDVDLVVHCSTQPDPFPTVVLEAMALSRPIIATRSKGPEESIDDGVTGRLVDPDDAAQLAGSILEMLGDRAMCDRISAAGAQAVRASFSAQRMTREFEQLFTQMTSRVESAGGSR